MKTQNTDYITAWEAIRTKHVKLLADNAALKVALRTLVDAASERINEIGTAEELDALKAARAALEG